MIDAAPAGVCGNCFATWRAKPPALRSPVVYCVHGRTLAKAAGDNGDDWRTARPTERELTKLRKRGLL